MSDKLAIDGGPKSVTECLTPWPRMSEEAIKAVEEVLRSGKVNYWTGPKGQQFELEFAKWQGSSFAISVNSGTSALHVALAAAGIGPGDEVIVPSYTFIATSFSVVQAGAIPRFADVNIDDHCISVESIKKLITPRTKAIIPVHLYGNVCDMDPIMELAKEHDLIVIEDNAEAFGGSYKGRKTGTIGHLAACSFCQNKTFTTGGEGGHGHHGQRRLRLGGTELPRSRLRRERASQSAGVGAKTSLHPQSGRVELPDDRDAIRDRPGGTGADGQLEHADAEAERPHRDGRPGRVCRR